MRYHFKDELVADIVAEHGALRDALDRIPEAACDEPGVWGDEWSVADLISHLSAWHELLLGWWREGQGGSQPEMPAPGYKWNETPRLNRAIQARHSGRPCAECRGRFESTHAEVLARVRGATQADLFEPGRFDWTGKNALVTYVGANTASHYRFARKVIKRWERSRAGAGPQGA